MRVEPWDVFVKTVSADDERAVISAIVEITSDVDG